MQTRLLVPTILLLATAAGCAGQREIGSFDAAGFHHARLDYAIESQGGEVMTSSWQLDNFQLDPDGRPIRPKIGPDYQVRRRADVDGDGRVRELGEVPAYDLRYRSARDAGVIWVRTIPLAPTLAQTDLRVLTRLYVDAVSGSGLTLIDLGSGRVEVSEHRFATREVESAPAIVGGREAYAATLEVASVDQLALSPDHRWERARIVLVRTDLYWGYDDGFRQEHELRPVLMVLGYSNLPEDFDSGLADFESLVQRVRFETPGEAIATEALACAPDRPAVSFVALFRYRHVSALAPGSDATQRGCLAGIVSRHRLSDRGDRAYAFRREPATLPPPPAEPPVPPPAEPPSEPVAEVSSDSTEAAESPTTTETAAAP